MSTSSRRRSRLIFRLSSMGDVILATTALSSSAPGSLASERFETDWVVSSEFSGILKDDPRIRRVWSFDRNQGLSAWVRLCRKLANERYDEVLDLHSSLRTRIARFIFLITPGPARPRWVRLAKARWRHWGYCLAKGFWPKTWRPLPYVERYARLGGGTGVERPDLSHLVSDLASYNFLPGVSGVAPRIPAGTAYLCVMPGAKWPGKRWRATGYAEVLEKIRFPAVIFGTEQDFESAELIRLLKEKKLPYFDFLGQRSFTELATILRHSLGYLGSDTGMAHLAESVGAPALMIFGPTVPELGFGPWRKTSRTVGATLWCRPCGKDGRACFRRGKNRHLCLKLLAPHDVESVTRQVWPPDHGGRFSSESAEKVRTHE